MGRCCKKTVHDQTPGCKHRPRSRKARALVSCIALWDLSWKAAAIHQALQKDDKKWVLPLALVNSVGLLPIIYLAQERKKSS